MDRIFFHLDVNSAFLSWSAAYLVNVLGERTDLRQIPSVVGGAEEDRHGIVLAGSIPAKRCGIRTGQTLYEAMKRCPDLVVIPPDYALYEKASRAFLESFGLIRIGCIPCTRMNWRPNCGPFPWRNCSGWDRPLHPG